ncbi:sugar transferase [Pseudactinotalea terrae]|uniref:sugar transferase n=1 Tax=Pseudactinotalea terrae TaxID=1743262 RepID=UPI0012E2D262|nr:sugar transferase [Pseudactinotalea terrae]
MSVVDRIEALAVPERPALSVTTAWRSQGWPTRFKLVAVLSDAVCALAISAAVGHYVSGAGLLAAVLGTLTFVGVVAATGGYSVRHVMPVGRTYRAIVLGGVTMVAIAMAVTFFGLAPVPPLPVLLGAFGVAAASALLRTAQRIVLASHRVRKSNRSRVLLVAPADRAEGILSEVQGARRDVEFVGACVPGHAAGDVLAGGVEILGEPRDARAVIERSAADVVLVAPGSMAPEEFRQFQWAVENADAELVVVPEVHEVLSNRIDVQTVGGTPTMTLLPPSSTQRVVKQVMDRTLGLVLLLIFSPVILGAMATVKLTSSGPALFRQIRIGRDGAPFTMLKLRTMVTDAEQLRVGLLGVNDGAGPLFKMTSDPRITPVGRVLRRFSIDELPQLWNVVRGDMSLVGPRPPLPSEVATYDVMAVHRLHVKPGLTGLWQVSGRSDLTWDESIKLDLRYVDNWSVGYDLQILWRTARAVLGARGAY